MGGGEGCPAGLQYLAPGSTHPYSFSSLSLSDINFFSFFTLRSTAARRVEKLHHIILGTSYRPRSEPLRVLRNQLKVGGGGGSKRETRGSCGQGDCGEVCVHRPYPTLSFPFFFFAQVDERRKTTGFTNEKVSEYIYELRAAQKNPVIKKIILFLFLLVKEEEENFFLFKINF